MKSLSKLNINRFQHEGSEVLSRERMRSIKGGGGGCYSYCGGTLTIRDKCDWSCESSSLACYNCY